MLTVGLSPPPPRRKKVSDDAELRREGGKKKHGKQNKKRMMKGTTFDPCVQVYRLTAGERNDDDDDDDMHSLYVHIHRCISLHSYSYLWW